MTSKKKMKKKALEEERKRKSKALTNSIFWLVFALIILFSFYRSNLTFKTTTYTVKSPRIPNAFNQFTIAQVSDLDGHLYGERGIKLKEAIDQVKPDIVVLTGSLQSFKDKNAKALANSFEEIAKTYPTYYIRGNAELYRDAKVQNQKDFYQALKDAGVIFAENESVPILRQGASITLSGLVPDPSYYEADPKTTDLPVGQFLEKPAGKDYRILLAHHPLYWEDYKKWGADLTLSGYVHGGGLRWLFVGGVFTPKGSLFPKYDRGLYTDKEKSMIVSAGMGRAGTPFRLFNPQELVVIQLESQNIH